MNQSLSKRQVELLAPAGTFEAFRAAINAGADAVYLGGSAFGARAYAGNFEKDELLKALDFAHARDRKVYLTVNTLLKDSELENSLYSYLEPYYKAGLDAVIVQDWGVFDLIKNSFPGLDIHASTQMAVTGPYGAKLLKEMGASRVVPARELNIRDIREIDSNVDIEIESFVHGALCYSYSGQCLLSSMLGDRSGNRGRCAQPCRMMYDGKYPLSLKDMCTLSKLPDMIEAGVDSLKIEGRMKSSEYVAGVVSVYRKYVDEFLSKGKEHYKVSDDDIIKLSDLYNRGGFSQGYYSGDKGRNMVSLERPNHQGTCVLEVVDSKPGSAVCRALLKLNAGDVIEIEKDFDYTLGENYDRDSKVVLRLPKNYRMQIGRKLYRTRNKSLACALNKEYVASDKKIPVSGIVTLSEGCNARLLVWKDDVYAEGTGEAVMPAIKRPLTKEGVYTQINKTNETPYVFESLEISMDDNIFMPNGQLNELRRNALEAMTEALKEKYARRTENVNECVNEYADECADNCADNCANNRINNCTENQQQKTGINVMLDMPKPDDEKLAAVLSNPFVAGVYIDEEAYKDAASLKKDIALIHDSGRKAYVAMPYVVKGKTIARLVKAVDEYRDAGADAWLVRNLETAGIFKKHFKEAKLITDAGLYVMNRRARGLYAKEIDGIAFDTAPYELTQKELKYLGIDNSELTVYGYIPVMLSENCVRKTWGQCDKKSGEISITDTKKRNFRIVSRCRDCYTVMYNSNPLSLLDSADEINELNPATLRLIFTDETKETICEVINAAKNVCEGVNSNVLRTGYTHGHFSRPIL